MKQFDRVYLDDDRLIHIVGSHIEPFFTLFCVPGALESVKYQVYVVNMPTTCLRCVAALWSIPTKRKKKRHG